MNLKEFMNEDASQRYGPAPNILEWEKHQRLSELEQEILILKKRKSDVMLSPQEEQELQYQQQQLEQHLIKVEIKFQQQMQQMFQQKRQQVQQEQQQLHQRQTRIQVDMEHYVKKHQELEKKISNLINLRLDQNLWDNRDKIVQLEDILCDEQKLQQKIKNGFQERVQDIQQMKEELIHQDDQLLNQKKQHEQRMMELDQQLKFQIQQHLEDKQQLKIDQLRKLFEHDLNQHKQEIKKQSQKQIQEIETKFKQKLQIQQDQQKTQHLKEVEKLNMNIEFLRKHASHLQKGHKELEQQVQRRLRELKKQFENQITSKNNQQYQQDQQKKIEFDGLNKNVEVHQKNFERLEQDYKLQKQQLQNQAKKEKQSQQEILGLQNEQVHLKNQYQMHVKQLNNTEELLQKQVAQLQQDNLELKKQLQRQSKQQQGWIQKQKEQKQRIEGNQTRQESIPVQQELILSDNRINSMDLVDRSEILAVLKEKSISVFKGGGADEFKKIDKNMIKTTKIELNTQQLKKQESVSVKQEYNPIGERSKSVDPRLKIRREVYAALSEKSALAEESRGTEKIDRLHEESGYDRVNNSTSKIAQLVTTTVVHVVLILICIFLLITPFLFYIEEVLPGSNYTHNMDIWVSEWNLDRQHYDMDAMKKVNLISY